MLYETSRDYLIKINTKDKPFDIFVTNGTILDRTYNNDFVVTDNEFNSSSNELKLTFDYSNAYGRASILIILGSLLISFGVISTIFMIFKGGLL